MDQLRLTQLYAAGPSTRRSAACFPALPLLDSTIEPLRCVRVVSTAAGFESSPAHCHQRRALSATPCRLYQRAACRLSNTVWPAFPWLTLRDTPMGKIRFFCPHNHCIIIHASQPGRVLF